MCFRLYTIRVKRKAHVHLEFGSFSPLHDARHPSCILSKAAPQWGQALLSGTIGLPHRGQFIGLGLALWLGHSAIVRPALVGFLCAKRVHLIAHRVEMGAGPVDPPAAGAAAEVALGPQNIGWHAIGDFGGRCGL